MIFDNRNKFSKKRFVQNCVARRSGTSQHSDLSVDLRDPERFETGHLILIGDVDDTFQITTLAISQKFYRKAQIDASTFHSLTIKKIYLSIMFVGYTHLQSHT